MISLYKKELKSFFSGLTGYLVIALFLLVTGLLMWVLPQTSILDHEFATLEQLFSLGPILLLFLIPALCMRSFAEEISKRTFELLITHPISIQSIVWAKFLAGFTIMMLSILPTLIYWYSVIKLGSPEGNIDNGATLGSYFGLILLAASFIAISITASALSSNQVVAFLLSLVGCGLFYWGFDLLGSEGFRAAGGVYWKRVGGAYHYNELSGGWIHLRNIAYLLLITFLFNIATIMTLRWGFGKIGRMGALKSFGLSAIFSLVVFFVITRLDLSVDLTEDKLYTLNEATLRVVDEIEDPVVAHILLEGDLPESMEKLQSRAIDLIRSFNRVNPLITYDIINPSEGTVEEINEMREELTQAGMFPVSVRSVGRDQSQEQLIFPYTVFQRGDRQMPVDMLGEASRDVDSRLQINNAISQMEYRFVYALSKILSDKPGTIAFTTGHSEFEVPQTADLRQQLTPFYRTGQLILDSVDFIPSQVDLVFVARPLSEFSNAEKFKLDQYIMEGGRVVFLVEPIVVSLDSLRQNKTYIPYNISSGLDDLLFKYGVRINADLIQDLECAKIPLVTNTTAQGPQYDLFEWFYYPLAIPLQNHPMTRNLDRVFTAFPSSIDTVRTQYPVRKIPVLTSSAFANKQGMPAAISFEILRYPPDPAIFDSPQLPIGYLLEGQLSSAFVNRPADGAKEKFRDAGKKIMERSADGKILVFSDAQIIENGFDPKTGEIYPMGYQRFENRRYGNREFIVNAVEYLLDDRHIIDARNKKINPRFLNAVKAKEEKTKWQLLNVGFPILLLALCGIIFQIVRRRIYV